MCCGRYCSRDRWSRGSPAFLIAATACPENIIEYYREVVADDVHRQGDQFAISDWQSAISHSLFSKLNHAYA